MIVIERLAIKENLGGGNEAVSLQILYERGAQTAWKSLPIALHKGCPRS